MRYNTKLTHFFWRTAERRGTQVAAVATARKLLVAIYWMLREARSSVLESGRGHLDTPAAALDRDHLIEGPSSAKPWCGSDRG